MPVTDAPRENPPDVASVAEQALEETAGRENLRGVGYYSPDGCEAIYLREDVRQRVSDGDGDELLEDAVLESIGAQALEDYVDDTLTGTVRLFEDTVVLYSCVADHRGVVVTFDRERDLDYAALLERLEALTDAA